MSAAGDSYRAQGYAALPGFVAAEQGQMLFDQFMRDLRAGTVKPRTSIRPDLLARQALELHGSDYPPMQAFQWGLTPAIAALTGADVVPTHCYFRIYDRDDICRAHSDREACEHSLSLMLASGGEAAWPLDVATQARPADAPRRGDFEADEGGYAALPMLPGDAVLYRGITHRHGRRMPNPNPWSAHLFLHWVERDGAFADEAFGAMGSTRKRRAMKAAVRAAKP